MSSPTDAATPDALVGHPAVEALRACIRIPTVSSWNREEEDRDAFDALLTELRSRFPRLHAECDVERIAGDALLVRWAGRTREAPVVLMAHLDVVPVGDESVWTHAPFAAEVADGHVWGRGALDCKGSLVATCSAVERLLADGFTPRRDVWLSFGCSEEVSGDAAKDAVALLRERGVEPWFVLDEGGAVVQGALPGVDAETAVVGTTEKGTVDVELVARGDGGHASAPRRMGATTRLARAVLRLERRPFPARLPEPTLQMFERLAVHARGPYASVYANARRLRAALTRVLPRLGPEQEAMTRTTTAVTQLAGSPGANVVAAEARAHVNVRVMVGETVDGALERLRTVVRDPHVEVVLVSGHEPSPVSPTDHPAYALIEKTTSEVFPGAVTVPYVMLAATDARHFHRVWPRVYRFTPFRMTRPQRESIHGVDERISLRDLVDGVTWYRRLIEGL
jgi:carboxypeptidase PM20D1